ncbi:hypothetical protein G7K_3999-t1 [Saitoella complicata NRRL Y-17804]|uniref:Uncharacterized protein n=1 Tax=Saitoella complicata (strain BCRC 22490 / CBS 7301 / JCM 7358 / NBRC 10748 / NRRL Y-17804) TaxID=698492 RepID=A0A0E9NJ30_SAICN|nr:hypothetical protein G7K_3999-t1 [Saitoella complicata NRRL Y-17804]
MGVCGMHREVIPCKSPRTGIRNSRQNELFHSLLAETFSLRNLALFSVVGIFADWSAHTSNPQSTAGSRQLSLNTQRLWRTTTSTNYEQGDENIVEEFVIQTFL